MRKFFCHDGFDRKDHTMRIVHVIFFILLLPVSGHALTPMDFNKGFPLELEPLSPLQRFELTYEIYEAGFRNDLGDLRIFNGNDQIMPMHLRAIPRKESNREALETTSLLLPVFPLETSDQDGRRIDDYRMLVNTTETGTVVSVEHRETPQPGSRTLLMDATLSNESMNGIKFELKTPMSSLLALRIEGSDDLSSWQLVGVGTLARMEYENARILKDEIPLYGRKWKYYRIQGEEDFSVLGQIHGLFGTSILPEKEDARRWHTLQGTEVEKGLYEYRLPKGLPASLLDLAYEGNTVLGLTFFVPDGEKNWRQIGKTSFFRIDMDGRQLKNDPFFLPSRTEHFRVAIKGTPVPLKVGWLPQEIIFMPQDIPPFLLAVGNPDIAPENLLGPMFSGLKTLKMGESTVGRATILAGEKILEPEPAPSNRNKMVLWSILVLGVVFLAGMALSLVKGVQKPETGEKK